MAKLAMEQLQGDNKSYNSAIHYLSCIFNAVQWQQQVKGCVPHTGLDSERYKQESREIICNLQTYAHTWIMLNGHPLPISLDKHCSLVLPPNLYDSLFSQWPMVPSCIPSPQKGQPAEDDNNNMMPAVAPGCTGAAAHMSSFVTTSMEWGDKTDWDSECDRPLQQGYLLTGMSDGNWAEDNIDMGDYSAHADEPPIVSDKCIEGASGMAEVPTIATHQPNPMNLSTPEESPDYGDDNDADKPVSEEGATANDLETEEEVPMGDVVIKEEYL